MSRVAPRRNLHILQATTFVTCLLSWADASLLLVSWVDVLTNTLLRWRKLNIYIFFVPRTCWQEGKKKDIRREKDLNVVGEAGDTELAVGSIH